MRKWYEGLTWGETLRRYYQWKQAKVLAEMEQAAKRDIVLLRERCAELGMGDQRELCRDEYEELKEIELTLFKIDGGLL